LSESNCCECAPPIDADRGGEYVCRHTQGTAMALANADNDIRVMPGWHAVLVWKHGATDLDVRHGWVPVDGDG
jgi:hypothetical protein